MAPLRNFAKSSLVAFRRTLASTADLPTAKNCLRNTYQFPSAASMRYVQIRSNTNIAQDSWAADGLQKMGEKLEPAADKPNVVVDDDVLSGPPPEQIKKLCNEILALNVVEVHQLLNLIQSRLGITDQMLAGFGGGGGGGAAAAAPGAAAAGGAPAAAAAAPKEKEAFDVKLTVVDAKAKIKIIKEIRTITGLGLKEAKDLVEKAPVVVKTGVKKEEAEQIKKVLLDAGAQVEVA